MTHSRKRWLLALPLGFAALAIGSIFGTAQSSDAARLVPPNNTAPPTISGTAKVGSTLTSSDGTFTGTAPLTLAYQWRRCDENGGSCSNISGATAKTYDLKQVDAGNTLRVVVTATNTDGNDDGTSVPTALVTAATAAPSTGCPAGTGVVPIAELGPPAHLVIGQQTLTPGVVTPGTKSIVVKFRISACGDRPVQGALLYVTAVPFNQFTIPQEGTSAADGTVSLTMTQLTGFPAARRQQLLVMFVRARKSGEDILAGVSARTLVSFPVSLK